MNCAKDKFEVIESNSYIDRPKGFVGIVPITEVCVKVQRGDDTFLAPIIFIGYIHKGHNGLEKHYELAFNKDFSSELPIVDLSEDKSVMDFVMEYVKEVDAQNLRVLEERAFEILESEGWKTD